VPQNHKKEARLLWFYFTRIRRMRYKTKQEPRAVSSVEWGCICVFVKLMQVRQKTGLTMSGVADSCYICIYEQ